MNDPRHPSSTWILAAAMACALIAPAAFAEADEAKKAEAAQKQQAPAEEVTASELRVEEGRMLSNAGAGTKKEKIVIPEGQVFTNALLDQLFGPAEEAAPEPAGEAAPATPGERPAPDPLKVMQDRLAEQDQRKRMIEEATQELEAAKSKLAKLEIQLRAATNPYAARPDLTEEEKKVRADSGESASARFDRTQKMVDEARAEVKAAEEKLAQLRSGS